MLIPMQTLPLATCFLQLHCFFKDTAELHAQVREVVKHTPELAQLVVANGGVGALVEFCNDSTGNNR